VDVQTELENVLFSIVRAKGFDEQYIDCYRMVTQFYQQRQPLCIIICGTSWTGAQQQRRQQQQRWQLPRQRRRQRFDLVTAAASIQPRQQATCVCWQDAQFVQCRWWLPTAAVRV
jgi:hypothetical protein